MDLIESIPRESREFQVIGPHSSRGTWHPLVDEPTGKHSHDRVVVDPFTYAFTLTRQDDAPCAALATSPDWR